MNHFVVSDLRDSLSLSVFMTKNLKVSRLANVILFPEPIAVIGPGDRFLAFAVLFVQTFLSIKFKKSLWFYVSITNLLGDYSGNLKTPNVNDFK